MSSILDTAHPRQVARLALLASLLGACAATCAAPPALTFRLATARVVLPAGGLATVDVDLQRPPGPSQAVELAVADLPAGVSAARLVVPAGSSSGQLTLQASPGAAHSLPTPASVRAGAAGATQPLTVTVRGQPGDIDTSFGGGIQTTAGGLSDDYARGVAVQADGKVVVAGHGVPGGSSGTDFLLLRFLRDGGLDRSFGTRGKVFTAFGNAHRSDEAQAVAVQPDGKLLVAGASDQGATGYDFALARYLPDGSLDTGFGRGGRVTTSFGPGADKAYALLLQPDGRIVLAGDSSQGGSGSVFALARYHPDGSLDPGFGQGGRVLTPVASDAKRGTIRALALQRIDGSPRLVAAGGEGDFIIARYLADGSLDAGFGSGGLVRQVFGSVVGAARGVVVTADNHLVVAGQRDHDFAAIRLDTDGRLDAGFGNGGRSVVAISADNWDEATALVQQADGRLLLGGWTYAGNSSSGDFTLVRLNADGSRDTGFGRDGVRIVPAAPGTKNDLGQALVLQPDDRIPAVRVLQAGEANASDHDIVLIRFWL